MAFGWQMPFVDRPEAIARLVHSVRAAEGGAILTVWPYVLVFVGSAFGFAYLTMLRREISNRETTHY